MIKDAWRLTLADGLDALRGGRLRAADWTRSLLERIAAHDDTVAAWAFVDADGAMAAAETADHAAPTGALHGAPVGIKDIIDVAGLPCEGGSMLYAGRIAARDADAVEHLRAGGATILGKTTTCELATNAISPVRNPHATAFTPGGSSAGSAAAVAAGMVPMALGTQTGGSVLRPAAYCGVVGFKPTYGTVSCTGAMPLSWSYDHVGLFVRAPRDLPAAFAGLTGRPLRATPPTPPRRVGFLAADFLPQATDEIGTAIRDAMARLTAAGVEVVEMRLPLALDAIHAATRTIIRAESAAHYRDAYLADPDKFGPDIRNNIVTGAQVPAMLYLRAQRFRARFRRLLDATFAKVDLLAIPATMDTAPRWEVSTGNPLFSEPFSASGHPAMTLPVATGADGLPIGLQLVGPRGRDTALVAAAVWCENALGWAGNLAEPAPMPRRPIPCAADPEPNEMDGILETVANLSVEPTDLPEISTSREDDHAN